MHLARPSPRPVPETTIAVAVIHIELHAKSTYIEVLPYGSKGVHRPGGEKDESEGCRRCVEKMLCWSCRCISSQFK